MKRGWIKYLFYSIALIVIGGILLFFINLGYLYSWTGFAEFTPTNPNTVPSKTLWDWLELLIIPVVLAGGAILLNRSERNTEREIATDRQQEAALQTYFDRMSDLLLKEKLRTTEDVEVRDVARTRTISIMRGLDTKRNNLILQFLTEANLITDENSIFNRANMSEMNLQGAFLNGANLEGANLEGAYLEGANLYEANLTGANLHKANLTGANLGNVNLSRARLVRAHLTGGHLLGANLERAILVDANLARALLSGANLTHAYLNDALLTGAELAGANLNNAFLSGANLSGANLNSADLTGADLTGVVLVYADLMGANLKDANNITDEQLAWVKSLKGATMPDGTKHK